MIKIILDMRINLKIPNPMEYFLNLESISPTLTLSTLVSLNSFNFFNLRLTYFLGDKKQELLFLVSRVD